MSPLGEGRHPGLRPLLPPEAPRYQGVKRGYSVHRFTNTTATPDQRFDVPGTHLYLAELTGSDVLMVRLDDTAAPWFPLEEGDVIVREFTRFWVRSNARQSILFGGPAEGVFYASMGPLVVKAPKKYGLRDGFFTVTGTAAVDGSDVLQNFAAQYLGTAISEQSRPAVLKYGGTMLVRNRSADKNLWLYVGMPGAFNTSVGQYPGVETSLLIKAGELLSLTVENRLSNLQHRALGGELHTLCLAGEPSDYEVTFSRMVLDYTDPESVPSGSGTPPLGV